MPMGFALKAMLLRQMYGGLYFVGVGELVEVDGETGIHECEDPAYERQQVSFGEPYEDGDLAVMDNVDDVYFAAWALDSPFAMTQWFLTDVKEGSGSLLGNSPMKRVITPERGDTIRFWPGDITVSLGDPPEDEE